MRCPWAQSDLMIAYHDTEWGRPVHDDRTLFESLTLEGAQAKAREALEKKLKTARAKLKA